MFFISVYYSNIARIAHPGDAFIIVVLKCSKATSNVTCNLITVIIVWVLLDKCIEIWVLFLFSFK